MIYTTLISVAELKTEFADSRLVIVDCRFSLEDTDLGRQQYLESHIPGAVYAHLDEDLCSAIIPGTTGRHPMPEAQILSTKLGSWGIDSSSKVVVYDAAGGAMAASRLWWLLGWLGHYSVAVLDGGWQAWIDSGGPTRAGEEKRSSRSFFPRVRPARLIESDDLQRRLNDPGLLLIDSRAEERYQGLIEPIDPVAGHIPGAILFPHESVLDASGFFLPREQLKDQFKHLFGTHSARNTVFYCGSGITAAQNILAVAHAGLGDARLYAGSWSEWITDPSRPIATGK